MKQIRIITLILFFAVIVIPVSAFNFQEPSVSLIDNRELAANPFSDEMLGKGDLTENVGNYVNDRIGFRDDMILAYTVLNDRVFHKMVHPSYVYGKDGYVFGAGLAVNNPYTDYHEAFADMVKKIQDYCDARDVPFLFVFEPAKPAVLTEYIPAGTNYDRSWVEEFLAALEERGVRYIDNTILLREKTEAGEAVFNQKYDANHWNALGAYYGVNAILEELQEDIPTVHVNQPEELIVSETLQTSLPVSEFPIHEMVPSIGIDMEVNTEQYDLYADELERHPSYQGFGYYVNEERIKEGAPRALVFQGSYMNSYGYKYLENGFGEYIHVHDYQNVIDFPYYFNIFQPDCVVFEVAEYTFSDQYFNYDNMTAMNLNPVLEQVIEETAASEERTLDLNTLTVESGETLTKISWNSSEDYEYAWLSLDTNYDMKKIETGYEVTVLTSVYERFREDMEITGMQNDGLVIFIEIPDCGSILEI